MKSAIATFGKRIKSNVTGQENHPGKRSGIKKGFSHPGGLGRDGFSERQGKPRASVKGGQRA